MLRSPEAPEEPDDEVPVRVEVGRREVIELGVAEYDGVFLFGDDSASGSSACSVTGTPDDSTSAMPILRRSSGSDDEELFAIRNLPLVRQRARQASRRALSTPSIKTFYGMRDLARLGATLYNQLPGSPRVQGPGHACPAIEFGG